MMTMKRDTYCAIIKASGIEKGDMVLIQYWMGEQMSEDIAFIQAEIAALGATPVMVVQNIAISQLINENVTENTYSEKYFKLYEDADVVIDFMERPIGVLSRPLEPEKMGILGAYMQRLFGTCASKKKILQLRVPTEAMAKSECMDPEEYKIRMEAAMGIDYDKLKEDCLTMKQEVEMNKSVSIVTKDGEYELSISFEGREWEVDAGDGDIPCGEISIAPIEDKTNGKVFFETIYLPDLEGPGPKLKFENVVLTIQNGLITETNQDALTEYFKNFGAENSTVCELGIGMNPNVTSLCGCAVLDEKMIGTFHLGIGDNTMFGGSNEADDHNDLIGKGNLTWK